MKKLTKQRRWQIQQVKKGQCAGCGQPLVTKTHCESCRKKKCIINNRSIKKRREEKKLELELNRSKLPQ